MGIEELSARFAYSQEAAEHLRKVQEKPVVEDCKSETGDLDFGRLVRHFEHCCDVLLEGQEEMQEKLSSLSSHIDNLSGHQVTLASAFSGVACTNPPIAGSGSLFLSQFLSGGADDETD